MVSQVKVSVVMPTYNDARYLAQAIESILTQSFQDFELIIVDDHSTDETPQILASYARQDKRLRLFRNATNGGVARSLNVGLNAAQGDYIARMDGDDVSHPERFERQVEFLDAHPEVGVLGTQLTFIDEDAHFTPLPLWEPPKSRVRILWQLLYAAPFCHPSVMMRTDCLRAVGGYDPAYLNEDMELWTRLAFITKLENLNETLIHYRQPPQRFRERLLFWEPYIQQVSHEFVERLLDHSVDPSLLRLYYVYMRLKYIVSGASHLDIFRLCSLLREIFTAMQEHGLLDEDGSAEVEQLLIVQTQSLIKTAFDTIAPH